MIEHLIAALNACFRESGMSKTDFAKANGTEYIAMHRHLTGGAVPTTDQALRYLSHISQNATKTQKAKLSKQLNIQLP